MNEKVEAFLQKQTDDQARIESNYRYRVMEYAGLMSDEKDMVEITIEEYNRFYATDSANLKFDNGRYYQMKTVPIEISEEEFKAVEASLPHDKLEEFKLQASGVDLEKDSNGTSKAATFFTIIAWLLWIGGLIIAIAGALSTEEYGYYRTRTNLNFTLFITAFLTYFIYGCFAMCAAELFKKLQTIVNLLKRQS